jgi:hypothetical protein
MIETTEKVSWLDSPVPMPVEPPPVPLFEDEPEDLTDIIAIDKAFRAMRYYEDLATNKKLERDALIQEYSAYYDKKVVYCQARIEHHKASIAAYLASVEKNSVATPSGSAHFRTSTKVTWPEKETLLAWAKATGKPNLIRTKEEVVLKEAGAYVKETGDVPPGYEALPVTTLVTQ